MKSDYDSTRDVTYHGDVELKEFFARPILLQSYTWTPGTVWTDTGFSPWSSFLANKRVSNRISNYANFSGKMCVKVLVNGNPFYYGRLMMYYVPLPYTDVGSTISTGTAGKIMNSQRMKIFIDPAESQAGTMTLPFVWYYDKVDLTSTNHYLALGDLYLVALNDLKHANGSATPLTITVYGWMEDVKLSVPTSRNATFITTQGGKDEYGSGPISNIATAVAKASGSLNRVPMIGKYMRATEVAAGAGASIAKMFGMSRPTVIETPSKVRASFVGEFAVTDVADTCAKLTVDSKQELCIDSSVTGVNSGDELGLKHVASIESYLTTFAWSTSYARNTILFAARPAPQFYYRNGTPAYTTVPAMCYVANAFKYWRGTIRYRFQVVCSGYHKGRLLFVWDPIVGATTPEQNVQYTKVVDIDSEKDFVLDVAWGQHKTWCETQELTNPFMVSNAGTFGTVNNQYSNGVLTVYVLNELSTPNSTINNDIQVNVYGSMCEDAEFAAPTTRFSTYSAYDGLGVTPQAGDSLENTPDNNIPVKKENTEEYVPCASTTDSTNLVYMGETISSFRQLMKRYNLMWINGLESGTAGYFKWQTTDFPLVRGYDQFGLRTGLVNSYNPVNTTMLRYLAFAYTCYRGGTRKKTVYSSTGNTAINSCLVVRRQSNTTRASPTMSLITSTNAVSIEDQAMTFHTVGSEGMHLTPNSQQPVVEVELPFYRNCRFAATRGGFSPSAGFPFVEDLTHTVTNHCQTSHTATMLVYVSGAEDSNFSLFQGCIPFQVAPTFS